MPPFQQDLIKELRLRRWARQNYVPPERRCASWHPVVLEEMQSRDADLADRARRPHAAVRYVPLPPALSRGAGAIAETHTAFQEATTLRSDRAAAPALPHAAPSAEHAAYFYGS